jgi:transcriptional regulator with XRE-family HTH domain
MSKQIRHVPASFQFGDTLAQRVFQLREFQNLTTKDLAKSSRLSLPRIEDIEAGIETWLSTTDRQLLAKALNVEPGVLQEVEKRASVSSTKETAKYNADRLREIIDEIFNGVRELECPDCGSTLKCSLEEALDLEGRSIAFARAFCIKCPFILRNSLHDERASG